MTQEIVGKLQGELSSSDRSGQPDREEEKRVLKSHDRTRQPVEERLHKVQEDGYLKNRDDADKFNLAMDDENIDFNISGIPDATVKRSQSVSVHDLIQKIESHPQKEAIQNDLEQHRPLNPFSAESKVAIMAAGNTELCEKINVEPKLQCKACLKHWSAGSMSVPAFPFRKDSSFSDEPFGNGVFLLQGQNPNHVDLDDLVNSPAETPLVIVIVRTNVFPEASSSSHEMSTFLWKARQFDMDLYFFAPGVGKTGAKAVPPRFLHKISTRSRGATIPTSEISSKVCVGTRTSANFVRSCSVRKSAPSLMWQRSRFQHCLPWFATSRRYHQLFSLSRMVPVHDSTRSRAG